MAHACKSIIRLEELTVLELFQRHQAVFALIDFLEYLFDLLRAALNLFKKLLQLDGLCSQILQPADIDTKLARAREAVLRSIGAGDDKVHVAGHRRAHLPARQDLRGSRAMHTGGVGGSTAVGLTAATGTMDPTRRRPRSPPV